MAKTIAFDEDAREAIRDGVAKLARAARVTFGPRGHHVMFEDRAGALTVTRDGVTVVNQVELDDVFENIGARMVREVADRTSERAGDGTTTATVLAEAIFVEGLKAVVSGISPIELSQGIHCAVEDLGDELRKMSMPVRGRKVIAQVATIACNQEREIGELLADVMERIGRDGIVTVEEGRGAKTEVDWVEGLRFDRGYLSPYFVTDPAAMSCVLDEPSVLITDQKISAADELLPLLEACAKARRPLLIVADDVTGDALALLAINHNRRLLTCCAVKAPEFGDHRAAVLEDLAIATGGTVFSQARGAMLKSASLEQLGRAKRATIDKDTTTLIEGSGRRQDLEARIAQIRREVEQSDSAFEREKLEKRLGRLTRGAAQIRVGAMTESEMKERKARIEDALQAVRAAIEEGILPGGGVALLRAAAELQKTSKKSADQLGYRVVLDACRVPLMAIADNAGKSGTAVCRKVLESDGWSGYNAMTDRFEDLRKAGVIDPTKVTRTALENAASVAALLLTSDVLIGEKPSGNAGGTDTDLRRSTV